MDAPLTSHSLNRMHCPSFKCIPYGRFLTTRTHHVKSTPCVRRCRCICLLQTRYTSRTCAFFSRTLTNPAIQDITMTTLVSLPKPVYKKNNSIKYMAWRLAHLHATTSGGAMQWETEVTKSISWVASSQMHLGMQLIAESAPALQLHLHSYILHLLTPTWVTPRPLHRHQPSNMPHKHW